MNINSNMKDLLISYMTNSILISEKNYGLHALMDL